MDLLLKHLSKDEIGEYVDETVRKHIGSPHTGGLSRSGGSHQYDEFINGLHDNLGKMNLGSNSIAQPHIRLPTTGDLQFNLSDRFQPANVNFPLDYQPPRKNYPPNQAREDVTPQRYTNLGLLVFGGEIRIGKLDNLKGTSQKKLRLVLLSLMVEWILMLSLIG